MGWRRRLAALNPFMHPPFERA